MKPHMATTPSRRDGDIPPKSTLFCPDCGHRSRPDGDWRTVRTDGETRLLCPDCGTVVTVRRGRFSREDGSPVHRSRLERLRLRVAARLWAAFRP